MIDPILSLAFSMHANKGVYALLLGSGVSRAAGIPTGWEVVLDLIRKLARMSKEKCEPDPAKWYKDKFSEEPDYSKLLAQVAKTATERSQLLRSYFEPTETEREQGLKAPTAAHRAIAQLVASGHVRVIITTNFDRLLERAIEEKGITPTVISTTDSIVGALPITHTRCTIVKVHGDYLDTRIKNAPEELKKYDIPVNKLLDRVFDEFGFIVCGWSADWDMALRAALERCKSRRFASYWAFRDGPSDAAKRLIDLRGATTIKISDANTFFQGLAEKLEALDEFDRPHPLSVQAAVILAKKYLEDDQYRIRLHDLVIGEAQTILDTLSTEAFSVDGRYSNDEFNAEFIRRINRAESLTAILQALVTTGAYWGGTANNYLWAKCLELLSAPLKDRNGLTIFLNLRLYPAIITMYSAGIAALAGENHSALVAILTKPTNRFDTPETPLAFSLIPGRVVDTDRARLLPGLERRRTPVSDRLFDVLRDNFRALIPLDAVYDEYFDRFEYIHSLVLTDLYATLNSGHGWSPIARFGWHHRNEPTKHIANKLGQEIQDEKANWPLLLAGLFGGSPARLDAAKSAVDQMILNTPWY